MRLNEDLSLYVANILEGLPATEQRLEEIRLHQQDDEVCQKLHNSAPKDGVTSQSWT